MKIYDQDKATKFSTYVACSKTAKHSSGAFDLGSYQTLVKDGILYGIFVSEDIYETDLKPHFCLRYISIDNVACAQFFKDIVDIMKAQIPKRVSLVSDAQALIFIPYRMLQTFKKNICIDQLEKLARFNASHAFYRAVA